MGTRRLGGGGILAVGVLSGEGELAGGDGNLTGGRVVGGGGVGGGGGAVLGGRDRCGGGPGGGGGPRGGGGWIGVSDTAGHGRSSGLGITRVSPGLAWGVGVTCTPPVTTSEVLAFQIAMDKLLSIDRQSPQYRASLVLMSMIAWIRDG